MLRRGWGVLAAESFTMLPATPFCCECAESTAHQAGVHGSSAYPVSGPLFHLGVTPKLPLSHNITQDEYPPCRHAKSLTGLGWLQPTKDVQRRPDSQPPTLHYSGLLVIPVVIGCDPL